MKFALTAFAAAALATMTALPAQAATIVNLNGVANASLTGTNCVKVTLDAGTYNLSFLNSPNLAFTRFSSVAGCDGVLTVLARRSSAPGSSSSLSRSSTWGATSSS